MKRSRRELSIDMITRRDIFKNNQVTVFPCSIFITKTGASFSCDDMCPFAGANNHFISFAFPHGLSRLTPPQCRQLRTGLDVLCFESGDINVCDARRFRYAPLPFTGKKGGKKSDDRL